MQTSLTLHLKYTLSGVTSHSPTTPTLLQAGIIFRPNHCGKPPTALPAWLQALTTQPAEESFLKHVSQGMFFCLKPSKHSPPHPEQSPFLLGLTKFLIGPTTPLMPSPTSLPLDYSHPVMCSSLLSFEHARNSPASGHLHYPFHLPRTLFSQKPHVSLPSSLCSNATSSERSSLKLL